LGQLASFSSPCPTKKWMSAPLAVLNKSFIRSTNLVDIEVFNSKIWKRKKKQMDVWIYIYLNAMLFLPSFFDLLLQGYDTHHYCWKMNNMQFSIYFFRTYCMNFFHEDWLMLMKVDSFVRFCVLGLKVVATFLEKIHVFLL
jgi:hypothetical protein